MSVPTLQSYYLKVPYVPKVQVYHLRVPSEIVIANICMVPTKEVSASERKDVEHKKRNLNLECQLVSECVRRFSRLSGTSCENRPGSKRRKLTKLQSTRVRCISDALCNLRLVERMLLYRGGYACSFSKASFPESPCRCTSS